MYIEERILLNSCIVISLSRIKDTAKYKFEQYSNKASNYSIAKDYMDIWGDYSIGRLDTSDNNIIFRNLYGEDIYYNNFDDFIIVENYKDGKIVLYNEVLRIVTETRKSKFQRLIEILFNKKELI